MDKKSHCKAADIEKVRSVCFFLYQYTRKKLKEKRKNKKKSTSTHVVLEQQHMQNYIAELHSLHLIVYEPFEQMSLSCNAAEIFYFLCCMANIKSQNVR